jgi:hypothetical protein
MVESAEIKVNDVITVCTWNTANANSVFKGVTHTEQDGLSGNSSDIYSEGAHFQS